MSNRSLMILLTSLMAITWQCTKTIKQDARIVNIAKGWAGNSINTVIFRRNSLVSFGEYQYAAFYDAEGNLILAKRHLASTLWEISKTRYRGDVRDAHNSISIMVDGAGYLHVAWNHHGAPLNYCRSKYPATLELTDKMSMTGHKEENVTYPEFYRLPEGDLLFLYRDGSSGNGNLVIDYYETGSATWSMLHENLIDGEGKRNAYWQMAVGGNGALHLSWVWRETWDVATNHDLCYAKSMDRGKTWLKSNGEKYRLPITLSSAEYAAVIPQESDLINQTSMCADSKGHPYIASYWTPKDSRIPQYHVVYHDGETWKVRQISLRKTAFSLSGGGTKRIPISRPQIIADAGDVIYVLFRDVERGNCVSMAACADLEKSNWMWRDLTTFSVGQWEPTYDTELWKSQNKLHILIQNVGQGDAEQTENTPPQMVSVLEWNGSN